MASLRIAENRDSLTLSIALAILFHEKFRYAPKSMRVR
jgi:hypothetical protein